VPRLSKKAATIELFRADFEAELHTLDSISDLLPKRMPRFTNNMKDITSESLGYLEGNRHYVDEETPLPSYELIVSAFRYARKNPWVKKDSLHPRIQKFVSHVFDLAIPPAPLTEAAEAQIVPISHQSYCSHAEGYFYDTAQQIETGRGARQTRVSVYHDSKGQPLVMRKKFESSTGLTLIPLAGSGLVLPAGMIVGLEPTTKYEVTGRLDSDKVQYVTYGVEDDELKVSPLRCSAWVQEDPDKRRLFALEGAVYADPKLGAVGYDQKKANMLANNDITRFQEAAAQVMQFCGAPA
jgi:hypothetical protein